MERADNYSLLILAGGKSSRMGKDKAELLYEGKTFAENIIEKAKRLGIRHIYLSGHSKECKDVQTVYDIYPENGPLGGIHAGLNTIRTSYCLVLPVDIPQIPKGFLEELLNFHEQFMKDTEKCRKPLVVERADFLEPLIGIYPVCMKDFIEERIFKNSLSVFRTIKEWGYECYKTNLPETDIANINTREDYEKLIK